jgi:hypothetical protein
MFVFAKGGGKNGTGKYSISEPWGVLSLKLEFKPGRKIKS